ncbi:replicative DNA helicase [Vibrio ichthyoenteri ATCC 700023]|uniref:Replicative DNA helicase n=1 Tax=Vibrio ichthyoenteri ATCC 700023 TaxID=870968 RepID=F9S219_9VIBR|nr:replicative DNA helicase [Vibrio ichthyoenteri ATCC 700023]
MRRTAQIPPHSLEAELNVISGLLYNNAAWSEVSHHLHRDMFYGRTHRYLFDSLATLLAFHKDVSLEMLISELSKREVLNNEVFDSDLQQLVVLESNAVNAVRYVDVVVDRYKQRQLMFNKNCDI